MSMSAPSVGKRGSPGSPIASTGQGFGLRWQKRSNSPAYSRGRIATLPWTWPYATPAVLPVSSPERAATAGRARRGQELGGVHAKTPSAEGRESTAAPVQFQADTQGEWRDGTSGRGGHRRGRVGLAVARALALAGREVIVLDAAEGDRHRDELAQQRGHPRRDLLPAGLASRRASASRASSPCTPTAPSAASRTARCGKLLVATAEESAPEAGGDQGAGRSERRDRPATPVRRRSALDGAGAPMRRGLPLALDRHRRQPRLHARAAGRRRGARRGDRVQEPARSAAACATTGSCSRSAATSRCRCSPGRW